MLWNSRIMKMLPFVAMVSVECTEVGVSIISKAALREGMSIFVYVVYYNGLGTLMLLPFFLLNRKKKAPLTLPLLWRFFLLGLIGSTGQVLSLIGLNLSSPTLLASLANLIPIFTFILALIFKMETLDIKESSSQAKVVGTVVAVTGAFVVTLYRGPAILSFSSSNNSLHSHLVHSQQLDWIFGGLILCVVMLMAATWNIAQGATVKEYPEELTIVFFYNLFITIQSFFFSLIFEPNFDAWKLKPGVEIIAIVYSAIFGSIFRSGVHTWCLRKRGPLYVAMFRPLAIVISSSMVVIFLGDTLYLGSVIGSIVIAIGFYNVMWGKMKEKDMSSTTRIPLLQGREA